MGLPLNRSIGLYIPGFKTDFYAYVIVGIVLVQLLLLALIKPVSIGIFFVLLGVNMLFFWIFKKVAVPSLYKFFILSWCFGGLGMVIGRNINLNGNNYSRMVDTSTFDFLLSGTTIGMFLLFSPLFFFFCLKNLGYLSLGSKVLLNALVNISMLIGLSVAFMCSTIFFPDFHANPYSCHFLMMGVTTIFGLISYSLLSANLPKLRLEK